MAKMTEDPRGRDHGVTRGSHTFLAHIPKEHPEHTETINRQKRIKKVMQRLF